MQQRDIIKDQIEQLGQVLGKLIAAFFDLKTAGDEERDQFFNEAVLAQDEYQVEQCYDFSSRQMEDGATPPIASGYWIIRAVLGRRDIILDW